MASYLKSLYGLYIPENSKGQGMVEYGLILVLVAIAAVVALGLLGDALDPVFEAVTTELEKVGGSGTGGGGEEAGT